MLLTSLVAALPALTAAASTDPLLRLVPADTLIALRLNDVARTMSRSETSHWVGFFADPQWRGVLAGLRDLDGGLLEGDDRTARDVAAQFMDGLAGARGVVLLLGGDPNVDEAPRVTFAAIGGDGVGVPLSRLMRTDEPPRTEGDLRILARDDGVFEAYVRRGDLHICVNADDAEGALAHARTLLERIDAGTPMATPFDRLAAEVDAQVVVNLRRLWQLARENADVPPLAQGLWDAVRSVEWAHMRMTLGDEEDVSIEIEAPYAQEGLAASLAALGRTCDPSLMRLAPAMAVSANTGSFDVAGLLPAFLEELEERAPDQHELARSALTSATEAIGVDVEGDLIGGLTGQMMSFVLPADMYLAAEGNINAALGRSCMAFGITDDEPFISALETVVEVSGAGAAVEAATLRGAEVWSTELEGTYMAVAVHSRFLVLAYDPDALEAFLSRANGDEDAPIGFLERPDIAEAASELEGCYVSLGSTRSTVTFAANAVEGLGDMISAQLAVLPAELSTDDLERIAGVCRDLGRTAEGLADRYFDGLLRGRVTIANGRIRSVTSSR